MICKEGLINRRTISIQTKANMNNKAEKSLKNPGKPRSSLCVFNDIIEMNTNSKVINSILE